MKHLFFFLTAILLCVSLRAQSVLTIGSTTVIADTVLTGLDVPWEIIYGPDQHIWMTERSGMVSRVDPVQKTRTTLLDLSSSVYVYAEAGLLGLALHPDFPAVNEVFLVYTYSAGAAPVERLVKYNYSGGQLITPQILLDGIAGNSFHNGSRLMFMPDKTLLMTTGEAGNVSLSQNLGSLNGKVLRLNADGTVPDDNPFPGSYVYTYGHRNAQGLTKGPNGLFYLSEHGTAANDEFQVLEKGRNYGWPDVEGFCNTSAEILYCNAHNIKEPLLTWDPSIAPSDLVYYSNNSFPEFDNSFLMGTLKEKKIVAIRLDATGTSFVSQASYLANLFGRLRDVCIGPNYEIYIATNGANAANTDLGTHSLLVLRPPLPLVSLAGNTRDPSINVFPGIIADKVTITTGKAAQYTLEVTDLCGKRCYVKSFEGLSYSDRLSGLENGLYVLSVKSGNSQVSNHRIIVAR